MMPEQIILLVSVIMVVSAVLTKVCFKIGIPTLILFLSLGMLIGAEGVLGLQFSNHAVAMLIGVFALSFIVFNGGVGTTLAELKPVFTKAILLATLGVIITAVLTGLMAIYVLKFPFWEGMLLGAVVSSTDAAATFSVLRSSGIRLKNNLDTLLESESGSNDPLSYMLTALVLTAVTSVNTAGSSINASTFIVQLVQQITIGASFGIALGFLVPIIINKVKLGSESLYPMFAIALALMIFSLTSLLGGNGLLAIYIAGLLIGNKQFVHKKTLIKFFDGQSWIMQLVLFVMLGLLVSPHSLPEVAGEGIIVALFITFVSRPIAVFSILSFFKTPVRDMLLVSWAGLRGAASMVFAIFPLMAGIAVAPRIFNIVFFIALFSILFQGGLLPLVARLLKLSVPYNDTVKLENFSRYIDEMEDSLMDLYIFPNSHAVDKSLWELEMPDTIRIIRIRRGNKLINPNGKTVLNEGDNLLLLVADPESLALVRSLMEDPVETTVSEGFYEQM